MTTFGDLRMYITTSEDLVVVLEQRLKTPTLLLQELQGLLLQQPSDVAHGEAAWRAARRGGKGWKTRVTKKQEGVYRCYIHQYINTLLRACTEIISRHHQSARKRHPIQLDWLESMSAVWHCLGENAPGVKGWLMLYTEHFTARNTSLTVFQCYSVLWSVHQRAVRTPSMHSTAASLTGPLDSVSHCRHSPTGTVILDANEQKKVTGRCWDIQSPKQINGAPLCVHSTLPFGSLSWDFLVFLALPFPPPHPRREFNQGWPLVCTNDKPPPLPPHIGKGHVTLLMLLSAFW